jgi:hypothetical protein
VQGIEERSHGRLRQVKEPLGDEGQPVERSAELVGRGGASAASSARFLATSSRFPSAAPARRCGQAGAPFLAYVYPSGTAQTPLFMSLTSVAM